MKAQYYFLILFFLFQNYGFAQQPLVAISDEMNVIYLGIENPVTIAVENFPAEHVLVSSKDLEVIKLGKGKYNFKPTRPGKVIIDVHPRGKEIQKIIYRVKRIPDPIARIGWISGGPLMIEKLKKEKGITADIQGFDLGKCKIQGFEMTIQYKKENTDPVAIVNKGGNFSQNTKELIETINSGDTIYFDRIKARCPGDPASRKINSMIFRMQ